MKAIEQYFPVVLIIMLYKVVITFASVWGIYINKISPLITSIEKITNFANNCLSKN